MTMTKYFVVQYGSGTIARITSTEDPGFEYGAFDSIAEAVKSIVGAADYIVAIEDGVTRSLNPEEQHEVDCLCNRP
jgi:hypothetical protein